MQSIIGNETVILFMPRNAAYCVEKFEINYQLYFTCPNLIIRSGNVCAQKMFAPRKKKKIIK